MIQRRSNEVTSCWLDVNNDLTSSSSSYNDMKGMVRLPRRKSRHDRLRPSNSSNKVLWEMHVLSLALFLLFMTVCCGMGFVFVVTQLLGTPTASSAFNGNIMPHHDQPYHPSPTSLFYGAGSKAKRVSEHQVNLKTTALTGNNDATLATYTVQFGNNDDDNDRDPLPWNPIYQVPEAMAKFGDRSSRYALLRKRIDERLPPNAARSLGRVRELLMLNKNHNSNKMAKVMNATSTSRDVPYDIHNCPDTPPPGYPFEWKLVDQVLADWPVPYVGINAIPSRTMIHQGLCIFDYLKDYDKAVVYRQAEVPFVVVNDHRVARVVERWDTPGYLSELLGGASGEGNKQNDEQKPQVTLHRVQHNTNSHFLFNAAPKEGGVRRGVPSPQVQAQRKDTIPDEVMMTYDEWLTKANRTTLNHHGDMEEDHWYFRVSAGPGMSEYLYDELPFFQPRTDDRNEIYLGNPRAQQGIHCRFGMKGTIAENHYDNARNAIAMLGGHKRYILSHPRQCPNLALFPFGHESYRHSAVDYANPDLNRFPAFARDAMANEVVLEAGMVLYLPSFWFHYIVSLDLNFQCNARSGTDGRYLGLIKDCEAKL